ncbi:hypothetical protein ACIP9H_33775 [Streptomyces sp. NPDC088732]|uniref:hypothetical protein n=1 Tax=Streptomyces sp. NPDC088732 TaxID=3365879 RepID=UPI003808D4C6
MTTQRTPRALVREAAGLFLTALGALGVLAALGALHWAAGAVAALTGLITAGLLIRRPPGGPWARRLGTGAAITGYAGLTACAFALCTPLGWLGTALAVAGGGIWLASGDDKGAA